MASIPLTITNGTPPYTISVKMLGDPTERFLSYVGTTLNFIGDNTGVDKTYNVIVGDSEGCIQQGAFPMNCSNVVPPSFEYDLFQPYCSAASGGTIQPGMIRLKNILNGTRYKICYNSATFSPTCNANCTTSDGFIVGTTIDIPLTAPPEGQSQYITIRVYNGNGCLGYTDVTVQLYSQKCSTGEVSMIILDLSIHAGADPCHIPPTNDYSFYAQITNTEITEKTQKATSHTEVSQRNIPNNNEVPNVFISAPKTIACGPGPFYRFGFYMSAMKSKYPGTDTFSFDIYANKTIGPSGGNCIPGGSGGNSCNEIRPQTNTFKGVRLVKQDYPAQSGNPCCFSDFFRDPLYSGTFVLRPLHIYNTGISGYRKIGTLTYTYSTNTTNWIPA